MRVSPTKVMDLVVPAYDGPILSVMSINSWVQTDFLCIIILKSLVMYLYSVSITLIPD